MRYDLPACLPSRYHERSKGRRIARQRIWQFRISEEGRSEARSLWIWSLGIRIPFCDRGVASFEDLVGVDSDGIGNGETGLSASTVMDRLSFSTIEDAVDWRNRSRDPSSAFNSNVQSDYGDGYAYIGRFYAYRQVLIVGHIMLQSTSKSGFEEGSSEIRL